MFRIPSHPFPCRSASTEKLLCSNLFLWKNSSCTVWQRRLSDSSAVFRAGVFTIVTGMWPQLPGLLASAVWASSFFTRTSCTVWHRRLSDSSAVFRAGVFTIVIGMWPQLPGLLASAVWASSFFTRTSSSCESHPHGQTAYNSDRHHCSRSYRVSWSQSRLALLHLHVIIVRISLSGANSLR